MNVHLSSVDFADKRVQNIFGEKGEWSYIYNWNSKAHNLCMDFHHVYLFPYFHDAYKEFIMQIKLAFGAD